jgi:hypothetical protein
MTSVYALPYADFDLVNQTASVGSPVTGTFDLTLPAPEGDAAYMSGYPEGGNGLFQDLTGFVPGMTVTDASVGFWLSDPNGGRERWDIIVTAADTVTLSASLATGSAFSKHFQATGIDDQFDILLSIGATGKLNYSVSSLSGDFVVDAAILQVNALTGNGVPVTTVPDGGTTAIFLGLGLLGAATIKNRAAKLANS